DVFEGKKSAQIREILISESTWEEMTCLFAPSLKWHGALILNIFIVYRSAFLIKVVAQLVRGT
ncbi:hypothetical protein ACVURW_24530, partial [Escherichia coli]